MGQTLISPLNTDYNDLKCPDLVSSHHPMFQQYVFHGSNQMDQLKCAAHEANYLRPRKGHHWAEPIQKPLPLFDAVLQTLSHNQHHLEQPFESLQECSAIATHE